MSTQRVVNLLEGLPHPQMRSVKYKGLPFPQEFSMLLACYMRCHLVCFKGLHICANEGTKDIRWLVEGQDYTRLWWEVIGEKQLFLRWQLCPPFLGFFWFVPGCVEAD